MRLEGPDLRRAVFELLDTHPTIIKTAEHLHAHMYRTQSGRIIGIEPELKTKQKLWVCSADIDATGLGGIETRPYHAANYGVSKPNHNLFGKGGFDDADDVTSFKIENLWQAVRVILEVAGRGGEL